MKLLKGQVDLDNLVIDGLKVRLVTLEDGTQSWNDDDSPEFDLSSLGKTTANEQTQPADHVQNEDGILDFLSDKTASFSSIGLEVDNQVTGFTFDFDLTKLNLDQMEGNSGIIAVSEGTVNGQKFEIKGNYPKGQAFTTRSSFVL